LVSPAEFIPLAERTGLIIPLGELVLDLACAQLASWRAADCLPGPLAINVAALQIERSDYVTSLATALARYDLPAQLLEVEITESLLMESQQQACAVLAQLQAMGVATAVDDFGTGYSSLAYLRSLPIDHLKIDRAFIKDLPGDDDAVAVARAIIDLGHALGFRITAEGIETQEQYDFLRNAGCNQGQGYLMGRPMPAPALQAWLVQHEQRRPAR
jgi:EAL domain-containing protein (putative c-di-GMP-specific phosphodiesterase class I)